MLQKCTSCGFWCSAARRFEAVRRGAYANNEQSCSIVVGYRDTTKSDNTPAEIGRKQVRNSFEDSVRWRKTGEWGWRHTWITRKVRDEWRAVFPLYSCVRGNAQHVHRFGAAATTAGRREKKSFAATDHISAGLYNVSKLIDRWRVRQTVAATWNHGRKVLLEATQSMQAHFICRVQNWTFFLAVLYSGK